MVNDLKSHNISVIFYRLRRVVFRVIIGTSMHPTLFHNCRSEEEVYNLIKNMNENKTLKHSISMCVATLERDLPSNEYQNKFGTRHHWLTQSAAD